MLHAKVVALAIVLGATLGLPVTTSAANRTSMDLSATYEVRAKLNWGSKRLDVRSDAAIRNTSFYEVALVGPRARNPLPPVYASDYSDDLEAVGADGCFPVPDGPGLGVAYDWDWIAAHRTAMHEFK